VTDICELSDLPPVMCAHCRGHDQLVVADQPVADGLPVEARQPGRCGACERGFPAGTDIVPTRDHGWVHLTCIRPEETR
jgi:hypothetical protein